MTAQADKSGVARIAAVVIGVGITSIIGWGTSFSAIAILGTIIGKDLGLSREVIFGGITIMLIASGLAAPRCGRLIDREGPRRVMTFGSALAAVALSVMARSNGLVSFWAAWALFGLAVPLALSNASVTAIAQIAGPHARRAITGLTILAGITSAIFLPVTAWLEARYGWRATLAIFSLMHIGICLPIHYAIFPQSRWATAATPPSKTDPSDTSWEGSLPEGARRQAFWLIVLWSCCEGILVWGFNMQAVDLLRGLGATPEAAIAVWMLSGPSQSIARVVDFLLGSRIPAIRTAVVSAAMAPIGFGLLMLAGMTSEAASVMAICYGLGHGLFVVARNVLPLRLFGLKTLGETMGRMSLPQNLVNAAAPIVFASILARYGPHAALWFSIACGSLSFVCVLLLARSLSASGRK